MNLIFSCWKQYFTHSLRSFVKYCFHYSKIKSTSLHHRVISTIYHVDASILLENNQWRIFHILTGGDIADVIYRFLHWIYIMKRKLHAWWLEDMNFILWWKRHFTHSQCSFVKHCFHHSKIKSICSRHRVISSIYYTFSVQNANFGSFLPKFPQSLEQKIKSHNSYFFPRFSSICI